MVYPPTHGGEYLVLLTDRHGRCFGSRGKGRSNAQAKGNTYSICDRLLAVPGRLVWLHNVIEWPVMGLATDRVMHRQSSTEDSGASLVLQALGMHRVWFTTTDLSQGTCVVHQNTGYCTCGAHRTSR